MDDLDTLGVDENESDSAPAAPSPPSTRHIPSPTRSDQILQDILTELRAIRRENQHSDFSLAQLAGAVAQAFAVCAIGWGLYANINGETTEATIRLLAGIALQLLAHTWFSAASRR